MNQIMMNVDELAKLLQIKQYQARQIIKAVNKEREEAGLYVIKSRPAVAPVKAIFKYLNLEEPK